MERHLPRSIWGKENTRMSMRRSFQLTAPLPELNHRIKKSSSVSSKEHNQESRNIPHTKRVIHIKGLNGIPICFVRGAERVTENFTNPLGKYEPEVISNVSTRRTPVEKKTECRPSDEKKQEDKRQNTKASLHTSQLTVSQSTGCDFCKQYYQHCDTKNLELPHLMKLCEFLLKDSKGNVNIGILKASLNGFSFHFFLS